MKKAMLLMGMLLGLAVSQVAGQVIPLIPPTSKHSLYLDLDRLYNFNHYERNRIGIGLYYTVPLGRNEKSPSFQTNVYGAYGTYDRLWKYGGDVAVQLKDRTQTKFLVGWQQDLEQAASRRLESYRLIDVATNNSYLARQFSAINRLTLSLGLTLPHSRLTLQGRISREQYLFDNKGYLYQYNGDTLMPSTKFCEFRSMWEASSKWKVELILGAMEENGYYNSSSPVRLYARVLGQYYDTYKLGNYWNLNMFAQVGATTDGTPYSRMFDIGGCGDSYYYFRNTLLTVLPGEFVSNNYAYLNIRLIGSKPLWNFIISSPVPFVQLSGLWGCSWNNNGDTPYYSLLDNNFGYYADNDAAKAMYLMQPSKGLFEPAIGISNLLKYKYLNISFAVAYRVVPGNALYHRDDVKTNFSYMVGAAINL